MTMLVQKVQEKQEEPVVILGQSAGAGFHDVSSDCGHVTSNTDRLARRCIIILISPHTHTHTHRCVYKTEDPILAGMLAESKRTCG